MTLVSLAGMGCEVGCWVLWGGWMQIRFQLRGGEIWPVEVDGKYRSECQNFGKNEGEFLWLMNG